MSETSMFQQDSLRPDTLNLQDRVTLALDCLTRVLDNKQNNRMYFWAQWDYDPPLLSHAKWDFGDGTGRFVDAVTLARLMTGRPDLTGTET
jgi:hypothetical protein